MLNKDIALSSGALFRHAIASRLINNIDIILQFVIVNYNVINCPTNH